MWCSVYAKLLIRVSPYVDYLIDGASGGLSCRRLADEPIGSARVGLISTLRGCRFPSRMRHSFEVAV